MLQEALPGVLVLPVLGNHDYWPKNQLPAIGSEDLIYEALGEIWSDWIGGRRQVNLFKTSEFG